MTWNDAFVDRENRFALTVDSDTGRTFVAIPVENTATTYDEYYEVDRATFDGFTAEPATALPFVERARRRELDHLLLYAPGTDRGEPV